MSSGLELEFVEYRPGQWYWIRQSSFCPVECWDWREHDPVVTGPFPSFESADADYRTNERNTGGHSAHPHRPEFLEDKTLAACIARAMTPTQLRLADTGRFFFTRRFR